ncbi:unnamed protein product [Merluccius merluccius]
MVTSLVTGASTVPGSRRNGSLSRDFEGSYMDVVAITTTTLIIFTTTIIIITISSSSRGSVDLDLRVR